VRRAAAAGLACLLAAAGLASAGCAAACRFQGTGTVRHLEMEGGFYGIETDAGDRYRPVNLPAPYAAAGRRVRFCADPVRGLVGIHMWGVPVRLRSIEALAPLPAAARKGGGP